MKILFVIYIIINSPLWAQSFRLSEIAPAKTNTTKEFKFKGRIINVESFVVLSELDLSTIYRNYAQKNTLIIELNNKGRKKLKHYTSNTKKNIVQIAVIIDGEIVATPSFLGIISKKFELSGLNVEELKKILDTGAALDRRIKQEEKKDKEKQTQKSMKTDKPLRQSGK